MQRALILASAILCYAAFFVSFVYLVGFMAAFPALPTHVDKGLSAPPVAALLIDLGLIALFGLQHSVMARSGFKAAFTRIVPPAIERSLYCLATALALGVMFALWHPIAVPIWHVEGQDARMAVWALYLLGIAIVFVSTWLISHFQLFGLAQAWAYFRGRELAPPQFRTPALYRLVRHPLYLGFLIALWAAPDMSAGRLLFAAGMTVYLMVGMHYEEKDLTRQFGETYVIYRREVAMIVPGLGKS